MEFKKLGSSDVQLPAIGFGTWRFRGGVEPLVAAIECGAFLDTAETYGSEEVVGQALRGRRNQAFVATKALPRHFRRRQLLQAAEDSLRRLGTSYIDLYQLHWPNHTVPIEETMGAMEELVDAGKIRFIGVSNFSAGELSRAQKALTRARIVSNQVRYSLIDRTVEKELLPYCRQNQVTLIAFSPLGMTYSAILEHDPNGMLRQLSAVSQKTEAQLALNWLLAKEGVVALPKASSVPHVEEDCGACGWRLPETDYERLAGKVRYRRRSRLESAARRLGRHLFQLAGRNL